MILQLTLASTLLTLCTCEPPVSGFGSQRGYNPSPYGAGNQNAAAPYDSASSFGAGGGSLSQYGTPAQRAGKYTNVGFGGNGDSRYTAATGLGKGGFGSQQALNGPGFGAGYAPQGASGYGSQGSGGFGSPSAGGGYNGAGGGYNGAGEYGGEDDLSEPANYEFSYEVDAPEYGVRFGHKESRQGDAANGLYHVLLPDGRTQVVEYEADEEGYKPKISYQEPSTPGGGVSGPGGAAGVGSGGVGFGGAANYPEGAGNYAQAPGAGGRYTGSTKYNGGSGYNGAPGGSGNYNVGVQSNSGYSSSGQNGNGGYRYPSQSSSLSGGPPNVGPYDEHSGGY